MDAIFGQKIIHRFLSSQNVYKAVDNVHKSSVQDILYDIYYISGTHSYQQIAVH